MHLDRNSNIDKLLYLEIESFLKKLLGETIYSLPRTFEKVERSLTRRGSTRDDWF